MILTIFTYKDISGVGWLSKQIYSTHRLNWSFVFAEALEIRKRKKAISGKVDDLEIAPKVCMEMSTHHNLVSGTGLYDKFHFGPGVAPKPHTIICEC